MQRIGVVGGLGPEATLAFMAQVQEAARRHLRERGAPRHRDQVFPDLTVNVESSTPCRIRALLHGGESPLPRLAASLRALHRGGCDFAVMPCVTAHAWFAELLRTVPEIPLESIVDATVAHLDCGPRRWLLLATGGAVEAGLPALFMDRPGRTVVLPEEEDQEIIDRVIFDAAKGIKAGYGLANRPLEGGEDHPTEILLDLLRRYRDEGGIGGVILGCTDLPLAAPEELIKGALNLEAVDPLRCLADRAVIRCYGAGESDQPG